MTIIDSKPYYILFCVLLGSIFGVISFIYQITAALYFVLFLALSFLILRYPFFGLISYVCISPFANSIIRIGEGTGFGIITFGKVTLLTTFLSIAIRITKYKKNVNFKDPILNLLILYAIIVGFSLFKSIADQSLAYFYQCIVPIVVYVLANLIITDKERVDKFIRILVISTFISAIFLVIEYVTYFNPIYFIGLMTGKPLYSIEDLRAGGFFRNPNIAGVYLVMVFPFALYMLFQKRYITYFFVSLSSLIAILATLSLKSLVGLVVTLLHFFSMKNYRRYLPFAIIFVLFVIYFSSSIVLPDIWQRLFWRIKAYPHAVAWRLDRIGGGIKLFLDNPIWGCGYGNSKLLHQPFLAMAASEKVLHSQYVTILAEGGLVSFIPFLLLIIVVIRKIYVLLRNKMIKNDLVHAFLVMSIGFYLMSFLGEFFYNDIMSALYWVLVSIIMRGEQLLHHVPTQISYE